MKISDSIETTSGLHVFETPEDLIINSQVYDKFTMEPKPYNFFNINTLLNKNLLLHQVNILEYNLSNPAKEFDYNYYIQDNQDSSIFYCLLEIGKADPNQYLHKIQKKNNKYTLIKSVSPETNYIPQGTNRDITTKHYKIIGQTKDYIILIQKKLGYLLRGEYNLNAYYMYWAPTGNWDSFYSFSYISVKKSDFSAKYLNIKQDFKDSNVYIIKELNDSVIILEFTNNLINITRYSPSTNIRQVLKTISSDQNTAISNIVKFNNNYLILKRGTVSNIFYNINIDNLQNIIVTEERMNTNVNIQLESLTSSYPYCSINSINDKYISITIHDNQNEKKTFSQYPGIYLNHVYRETYIAYRDDNIYSNKQMHRHYLFKKENGIWNQKNIIVPDIDTQYIYGVLYFDNYTPIFLTKTSVEIYKLNLETETYNKVFEVSGTFQTIGLDENNNFYTFDINNNCKMYNKATCSTIQGDFEQETYNYDGEDIETTVTIASKNFIGELIASKIHIELSGNCKFRNGSQEAILTTRLDTEYEVPVIITGPGVVYCNINEVE